jgi:hypothetical protein
MIELPPKFKQAIGSGQRTSLYPLLRIYKGVSIDTDPQNQNFAEAAGKDNIINLSIKETSLDGELYLPLLLDSPSLRTTADIINNKFTTSSLSLKVSNSPYQGRKFSDNVVDYLKSVCQVFYTSNGIDSINDCLPIYTGTIRRFEQTFESVKLDLEDFTQQVLSAKVPNTLIPEDFAQYDESNFNKPYPMIYGNIDASPLVYNKIGRLEIDKPEQKVYGYWNFGTSIEYGNEAINDSHPFKVYDMLRDNSFLSVYEGSHLYIFETGVQGWGSRRYTDLNNLQFYEFENAHTTYDGRLAPASIKINDDAFVWSEYTPAEEDTLAGTGERGIPARVYRPIVAASFFSSNEKNRYHNWETFNNDGSVNESGRESIGDTVNKFIGYSNNSEKADNVVEWVSHEATTNHSVGLDAYQHSVMQEHYRADWALDSPSMNWWEPTYVNNITVNDDKINRWSTIDTNWRDSFEDGNFDVSWIQNGLKTSGLHMYAVNYYKAGGSFARFHLKPNVGSFPCVTKIFYEMDYISPKWNPEQSAGNAEGVTIADYNLYATQFWVNRELVQRDVWGVNYNSTFLTNENKYYWEKNRDVDGDQIQDDDWYTWGSVPNSQHPFGDNITLDAEAKRLENNFTEQFTDGQFYYHNILKDFNDTGSYDSIQWGFPYITNAGSSEDTYTRRDTSWAIANLKNIYVIQDVLINKLEKQDFFGNIAGRVDNVGEQIVRIEDIMVDILDNELGFQQVVSLEPALSQWKFDFTLNEQKEVKELFEGLFQSSIAIPSYDNFGQFKLIPIHQVLEGVSYSKIRAIDVINYSFTLSKLDDVKNRVNVKYYKDYATGELTRETGYALRDSDGNTYQTYDAVTQNIYPDNPEYWYDVNYYGLNNDTNLESMLEVESEYIRDEDTAFKLQKRLVNWYCNQHLIIRIDLPVSYLNLEAGDYFKLDELLGGDKVFGYDYTEPSIKNGQYIYPVFFINNINKSIDKVSIEAVQVHRGEYGWDDTISAEETEDGGVFSDGGGNNGQGNFQMGDPFDNPAYDDENINTEETTAEDETFELSLGNNNSINNGLVTGTVSTSYDVDWDYKIFALSIYVPDNPNADEETEDPVLTWIDDEGQEQTFQNRPYINEEDDVRLEDFFHISKSTSDLEDNYNGQIQISKKYAIYPEGCRIDAMLKVFIDGVPSANKYQAFYQEGEVPPVYPDGDVNGDFIVNVLDVVELMNLIVNSSTQENLDEQEFNRADINGDGTLNIQDIVNLINIIFGG